MTLRLIHAKHEPYWLGFVELLNGRKQLWAFDVKNSKFCEENSMVHKVVYSIFDELKI